MKKNKKKTKKMKFEVRSKFFRRRMFVCDDYEERDDCIIFYKNDKKYLSLDKVNIEIKVRRVNSKKWIYLVKSKKRCK